MAENLKSNGFGSFEKHLIFTVTEPHSEMLIKTGWEVVEQTTSGTVFKFCFKGRKTGDDETAVFELCHALPENLPEDVWRVSWEQSVY